jgi:hypothetical protein
MKKCIAVAAFVTLCLAAQETLPIFKSNRLRVAQFLADPSASSVIPTSQQRSRREFYVQREVEQQFGIFNISFQVDVVLVNDIEKPFYDKAYPSQQSGQPEFNINLELMQNALR